MKAYRGTQVVEFDAPLFDRPQPPEREVQAAHLRRVSSAIATAILDYCEAHGRFHMADLQAYVASRVPGAPASPDRVLRDLRSKGLVTYTVVNRRESLYMVQSVRRGDV